LLGREWIRHENLPKELASIDPQLAQTVADLSKLRESADYDPSMLTRDFDGDVEHFRRRTVDALERGRTAYLRLLTEIKQKVG
jgi:hypothetical protein